jgi:D-lactate dehydrogenase
MKIIFFGIEKTKQPVLLDLFKDSEIYFFDEKLDENTAVQAKDAEILCVFVNSVVNKNIIDTMPNLKLIVTRSTGFDHIDCDYAHSKGIKIAYVPAYGSHTVAEFTFGLILNLSRNIITANNYIKQSEDFNYFPTMEGFDLFGKTLGVIGTGKIGKNVIKIAKGFGLNILAYDLYKDEAFAKENNFEYKSIEEVLSNADILTLHIPYTKENHHLIDKEKISQMKKGIYLINTARGELIDTEALVWGLKEGIIAGLGADVLENERHLKDEKNFLASGKATEEEKRIIALNQELMEMPNVTITPHVAFYTKEAVEEIFKTTVDNIKGFIENNPINLIK